MINNLVFYEYFKQRYCDSLIKCQGGYSTLDFHRSLVDFIPIRIQDEQIKEPVKYISYRS